MPGRMDSLIARLGMAQMDPAQLRAMRSARKRVVEQPFDFVEHEGDPAILLKPVRYGDISVDVDDWEPMRRKLMRNIQSGKAEAAFLPIAKNEQDAVGIIASRSGDRMGKRHELMHAYNHAARMGEPNMPFASRFIAAVEGGNPAGTWRGAAGRLLDEYSAQRAGGRGFGDIPWEAYAGMYANDGLPQAARLAREMQRAQRVAEVASRPEALALAALAAGTAVGVPYALSLDEEQRANAAE